MSLIFNQNIPMSEADRRVLNRQWAQVNALRSAGDAAMAEFLARCNAARTPAEAYREFDSTSKIELIPAGEHATLSRVMQYAKPVSIGKEVFEYRKVSETAVGQSSMSGQIGFQSDKTAVDYGGTVIPIHDKGFGRRWREVEAMRSDGYDALVDDAREAERSLMTTINSYMWDGDSGLVVKGNKWLGIKADPSVATAVLGVDLSSGASAADVIRAEVARVRDILYITNNCTKPLRVAVSREIASNWERPFSVGDSVFGTIGEYIGKLRGIAEIYEDSELVGNQMAMFWADQQGFCPVVGMAINTYAMPRQTPTANFDFVKWSAVGFVAKSSYTGKKCALYAA